MAHRPFPSFRKGHPSDNAPISDVTPNAVSWSDLHYYYMGNYFNQPDQHEYTTQQIIGIDSPITLKFSLSGLNGLPSIYWLIFYKIDTQQPSYPSPTKISYQGFTMAGNDYTVVVNNGEYLTFMHGIDAGSLMVRVINVTDSNTQIDEFQCLYTES